MAADLRFQAIYTFNTLISMVTLIIDSCCDFVKTPDWTPRGGLKIFVIVLSKEEFAGPTKRTIGRQGPTHLSFGMTPTIQ